MNNLLFCYWMSLPHAFCWTRVGTEAGQSLDSILRRKESERLSNGGLFFWGVGNAIGPSLQVLVRECSTPEVLFTFIRSAARKEDAEPSRIAVWTKAIGLDDRQFELPAHALITSRFEESRIAHYALVCFSETPLALDATNAIGFNIGELENLLTGRPVGASQVTAVVRRRQCTLPHQHRELYRVILRARLAPPFFLRLSQPTPLEKQHNWEATVSAHWSSVLDRQAKQAVRLRGSGNQDHVVHELFERKR